jgi:uncharacterized protein (DUF58 family)
VDSPRDPRSDPGSALAPSARRALRQPSFFAKARLWLQPPRRLRPTRAGWCFFLLTFGVGFAALNTGNNLLYLVLSLMLAFLVLSGVLSELALRGICVRRRVPAEIFAEQPARVALEIANVERRGTAFAIVVEDRIARAQQPDRAAGRSFVLRLAPGTRETRSYALRVETRGPLEFRGFVVSTRFPFGLFSKSLLIEAEESALVYPAIDPIRSSDVAHHETDAGERLQSHAQPGTGAAVVGVRDYVAGDDRRRIDWRTSLRTGGLWVRELENERDAEIEVQLHEDTREPAELEGRVRRAASEIVAHLDAGRRVALRTEREHFEARDGVHHRARLLGHLALVEPAGEEAVA